MSSVIDERVVQMSFDNDQFEKGVSQTIKSLNKLDKTLVDTADGEYFTNMEERISKVEQAFSKSGMVINGILLTIGQTITQYINKGLAALTSGIRGGMAEYETQMGATQTILANVKDEGKGIDDVTAALDELNTYADKTIYNFTEMTRNIGMFTAAGANLDTSVATIKGLANAAALVGANATTAARAWYQVSQAMAAGSFKLMDWRSLEISNIAGEGFKSVLTEVARKDGLAVAKMIDNGTALRDTLKSGWLTAERFAEAMSILTNEWERDDYIAHGYTQEQYEMLSKLAQEAENAAIKVKSLGQLIETTNEAIGSGWAVTFRTLIGDFERAKTFFTRISITLNSIIDKIADYRNHFLDFIWNTDGTGYGSAYANFKETIDNILAIFSTFIGAIRAGFHNIFNWSDIRNNLGKFAKATNDVTRQFVLNTYRDVTLAKENEQRAADELAKLEANETNKPNTWDLDAVNDNIKKLIRIFRGLFAGVDIVLRSIGDTIGWLLEQIPGIGDLYKNLKDGNLSLLDNLANIADKVTMVRDMIVDLNLIPNILNLIKQSIINIVKTNPLLMGMVNGLIYAEKSIKAFIAKLQEINISPINILVGAIKVLGGVIAGIFYGIAEAIENIVNFFSGKTDFSFLDALGKEIGIFIVLLGELGKGTITVGDFFEYYKQKVIGAFQAIYNSPFVQGVVNFFVGAWNQIQSFWNSFIEMINTVGTYLSNFYSEYFGDYEFDITKIGIFGALAAIGYMIYKLVKDVEGWASIGARIADVLNAIATKVNSESLLNIAYAIGILSASIFVLSLIPIDKLMDTVSMLMAVMLMLMGLFAVVKATLDAVESVKTAIKPVEKIFMNLSKGLQCLMQRAGTAVLLEAIGDAFLKIAGALIAMGLAFQFMPEAMDKAVAVLTGIGIALAAILVILTAMTKGGVSGASGLIKVSDLLNLGITSFLGAMSQAARMVALAVIIEAFGDVILKLAAALAIITYVAKEESFGTAIITMIVMVAAMSLLVVGLYKLAGNMALVEFGSLAGLAIVFLAFAGAVATLAVVAAALSFIEWPNLFAGVGAVAALVLSLGGAVRLATKFIGPQTAGAFMALAAIFLALGVGLAAVAYTSSLIQSGFQIAALSVAVCGMALILGEVIGLMALMKGYVFDVKSILSLSAIFGAISLAFVSIGAALSMLDNVKINLSAIIMLIAMLGMMQIFIMDAVTIAIVAAVAQTIIPGLGDLIVATMYSVAAIIVAVGISAALISQAVLNFEDAIKNLFEALEFLAYSGGYFISVVKGAAETILQSIPDLFALFLSIGIGIGTAMMAITIGIRALLTGVVLNACTMILEVIILIADWINSNSDLILTAFSKLWAAVLNLAIIALKLALQDILPSVLSVIFNFFSLPLVMRVLGLLINLWSLIFVGIGDAFKNSGIPVLELIGEFFTVIGEAAGWAADKVGEVVDWINEKFNWIVEKLKALGIELEGVEASVDNLTNASFKMADGINDTMLKTADSFLGSVESMTSGINKFSDVNTKAVEQQEKNSKKYSDVKKAEAKSFGESTDFEVSSLAEGAKAMFNISDANMEDITGIFGDGFNLNLDNQSSYIEAYLSGVDYMGEQDNNKTAGYLIKNSDLYETYWKENAGLAEEYYTAMATYNSMMATAPDDTARKEAMQFKKDYVDPALKALTGSKLSLEKVLNDGIDYEVKPLTKQKQEAYIQSWTELGDMMSDYMGNYQAPEVDTDMYTPDFGTSSTDTSKLESELKDRNDTIGKYDSEVQPKDLTPTIDLDSLKNEVNQANGIMTGSLLAAQNAAIGDYINTDSELNPFLKDRWQNTYNFTQNNYSPKALSRIDIYRQTQNQLRLSRGF